MTAPVQRTVDGREELLLLIAAAVTQLAREWKRLTTAQDALLRALERIRPGVGATVQIRNAVRDFNGEVGEFDRAVRAIAERWAVQDLPIAYRDGAVRALERARADARLFRWTTDHQAAITTLTASFYVDVVGRIQDAVRRAQAFVRAAQDAAREVAFGSRHQGIDSGRLADDHPLSTIVYRDDSRHPVQDWARSALGYQAVVTANHAAINTGRLDLNAQWMEVRDGSECGWTGHDDHDHADGTIRSVEDCADYPIAHFGCIRELFPRPDLNGRRGLVSGDPA
ncbi:hypothetical protein ACFC08_28290 [Streptomyces sp. NPDC056112]|uniref:hypothetical protein n=1 Tax=Streptomyces sp. NPDC056112 TaxID=3345715 RepID=UPI0035DA2261